MVIAVLDHVGQCHTSADGLIIAAVLRHELRASNGVVLSFRGVDDAPSSFINAAIITLLDEFTPQEIRSRLRVVESHSQINDMIRRCMANASRELEFA